MKTKHKNNSGIRHLRGWFRTLINFQLSPRWITDPVAHRKSRPGILGAESPKEKRINDEICARFTAQRVSAK